jgi:hypothetical protein
VNNALIPSTRRAKGLARVEERRKLPPTGRSIVGPVYRTAV